MKNKEIIEEFNKELEQIYEKEGLISEGLAVQEFRKVKALFARQIKKERERVLDFLKDQREKNYTDALIIYHLKLWLKERLK